MTTNWDNPATAAELRRRAEERLQSRQTGSGGSPSGVEMQAQLHELQVHQIELEMQNEELRGSRAELEELLARSGYDFAPAGFLILAANGTISQANLAVSHLLNVDRVELLGMCLGLFVAATDLPTLDKFLNQVFASQSNQTCELTLKPKGQPARVVELNGALNPGRQECSAQMLDITERKQAEAALRKSEAELRHLFEAMPAGIYFCDAEGLITSFNQRAAEVWGLEPKLNDPAERFCGSFRLFAPDGSSVSHEQCWMARALRENKEYRDHEIAVERLDGSRRLLLVHASPLHDASGKVTGGVNIVTDITERRGIEAALQKSVERLNLALGAADLGIFEHDHRTDTTRWSRTLRRIFGWPDDEPASLPAYLQLIHPEDHAGVEAAVLRAHDPAGTGQYRIEHRIVLRNGMVRWINVLSRTTFAGIASERCLDTTIGTIGDITDLKQAQETLRENQTRLQILMEASNIGAWDWDLLSNEVYYSPQWKRQLGYAADELSGRYEEWETRLHPEDRERTLAAVKDFRQNALSGYEVEFRLRHKNGSWRWILARAEIMRGADGSPLRMMGCHIDITSRKQSEAELQSSRDRLAALSRQLIAVQETERRHLARELHDEIGQVLSAISVNLKTVHRKVEPALQARLEESVGIVDRAIQQVRDLSLDLRPAVLDDFGLEAGLRWYAGRFAERAGLTAHFTAHLTRLDLPEMVQNTCFRVAQETLTNVQRHGKAQQVWIDLQQQEDVLTLTIRDDGQGFDVPLALERAARGASFGMISMQERVELLGGRLAVESHPGTGTVVRIRVIIPVLADSAADQEAQP